MSKKIYKLFVHNTRLWNINEYNPLRFHTINQNGAKIPIINWRCLISLLTTLSFIAGYCYGLEKSSIKRSKTFDYSVQTTHIRVPETSRTDTMELMLHRVDKNLSEFKWKEVDASSEFCLVNDLYFATDAGERYKMCERGRRLRPKLVSLVLH